MSRIFGITGWSGCGKTSLITRLLPVFAERGIAVSTIKHAHHRFDIDRPGKDSYLHRDAGAVEVMISSANRFALMHETRDGKETPLEVLLQRMTPVDLVLIEGYKREPHPKLEVHRRSLGKTLLQPTDHRIVAVASDDNLPETDLPVLDLNDTAEIADFILDYCCLNAAAQ